MKKNLIPQIRFPEFKKEWEHKQLNELLSVSKTKNTNLKYGKDEVLSVSGDLGIVNQIEHLGRSYAGASVHNYGVVELNQIVYTKSPLKANPYGIIKLNKCKAGIVSTLYAVYNVSKKADGQFIEYYFSLDANLNRYLRPLVRKGAKNDMKISNEYVLNDRIYAPQLPEQQKIAHFFSTIDDKINQLQNKKNALQQYKKGVMQKIFAAGEKSMTNSSITNSSITNYELENDELNDGKIRNSSFVIPDYIRFKDDNGQDYPDWETKKLGEVGEFKNGINKDKKDFGFGYPFVNLMDVFGKPTIANKKFGLVNANQKELKLYEVKKGDVLFIRSSVKKEGVGETTLIIEDLKETVYSGFLIRFRDSKIKLNFSFKKYCFAYRKFREDLISLSTTSANTNINQESLNSLTISFPCFKEQKKIANFLTKIDSKITNCELQIMNTKEYKKGLLQKMLA